MSMEFKLLDKGFLRLVDFMGGDTAVVQAARVSFGGGSKGEEPDRKLIAFLMKNGHETPFEHSVFKFHVKAPIFVTRQWVRHRIASYNEISLRYVEYPENEFYVPSQLRVQAKRDRQASVPEKLDNEPELIELMKKSYEESYRAYKKLLESGVAREIARALLPVGSYTQFYWTVNARSLMNFLKLRSEAHAQYEIRVYAEALLEIFGEKMPWTCDAFLEHTLKREVVPA